jgi:hypothetical protein
MATAKMTIKRDTIKVTVFRCFFYIDTYLV